MFMFSSLAFFEGSIGIDEKQICTRIRGIHLYSGTEINGRPLAPSEMFRLYFTWSYCKQLASNVKLATGKYKIISRQLGSFEVLFSRQ
jgi:hypothetical protein